MSQVYVIIKSGQVLFCHFSSQGEDVKQSQEESHVLLLTHHQSELNRDLLLNRELETLPEHPSLALTLSHSLFHGLNVTQVRV